MDHSYIDQSNLVDRYLMGKLAADDSARFEEHFVDCPQCVDRLKTTRNFLRDLRVVSVERALHKGSRGPERLRSYFSRTPSRKSLALAASFLLALATVGAIVVFNHIQRLQAHVDQAKTDSAQWQRSYEEERQTAALSDQKRKEVEQELTGQLRDLEAKLKDEQEPRGGMTAEPGVWAQPGINVPVFALHSVRRGEQNPSESVDEITLSRSPAGFVISVGLEGEAQYKDYRITISDDGNRAVLKRGGFRPDRYNNLSIGFNSNFFRPGKYLLKVEGVAKGVGASPIGDYPFRVIKESMK
jgi:hypothetical protein